MPNEHDRAGDGLQKIGDICGVESQAAQRVGWCNNRVAVVLQTTWDTEKDAAEFHDAMQDWIDQGNGSGTVLEPEGKDVRVLFASNPQTLDALAAAAA